MKKYSIELSPKPGTNRIRIGDDFKFIKGFEILLLGDGKKTSVKSKDCEIGLVILSGSISADIKGQSYKNLSSRNDVFGGNPLAIYIPVDEEIEITGHGAEIALCYSRCEKKTDFKVIYPDDVKVMQVGKDNWQREVRIMIGPNSPSVNLIVGETINPPGNWSGTPPHKHERGNFPTESLHEEIYYFKTDRPNGFGIEKFYSDERGIYELIPVKNNTVTFMPWGYHQIVAGPGYKLYYLFFLSGMGKDLAGYADPDHAWLNK